MLIDINEFKMKKVSSKLVEIAESTKSGAYVIGEAILAYAYRIKEMDSQLKVNQRNIDKLNKR